MRNSSNNLAATAISSPTYYVASKPRPGLQTEDSVAQSTNLPSQKWIDFILSHGVQDPRLALVVVPLPLRALLLEVYLLALENFRLFDVQVLCPVYCVTLGGPFLILICLLYL